MHFLDINKSTVLSTIKLELLNRPIGEIAVTALCFFLGLVIGLDIRFPGLGVLGWPAIILGTVAFLVFLDRGYRIVLHTDFNFPIILAFIATVLITVGFGLSYLYSPNASIERLLVISASYLIVILIFPFMAYNVINKYWNQILLGYVLGIIILTFFSLTIYLVFLEYGFRNNWIRHNGRLQMWMGPNSISKHIIIGILVICYLNFLNQKNSFLSILMIVTGSLVVTLTGSNSGMLINLVCIGLFILLFYREKFFILTGALIGLQFLFKFLPNYMSLFFPDRATKTENLLSRFDWIVAGDFVKAGTYEQRLQLIQETWAQILNSPLLGVGPGVNSFVINDVPHKVHNTVLLLWSEGGILALLGFVFWSFSLLCMGLSTDRSSQRLIFILAVLIIANWMTRTHAYQLWTIAPVVIFAVRAKMVETDKKQVKSGTY